MKQLDEYIELKQLEDKLQKLESNLRKSEIKCALPDELFARIRTLWEDPYSTEVVTEILEIKDSLEDLASLEQAVFYLIKTSETLPYREKAKIDGKLKRLVPALPYHSALGIAKELINHKRKRRCNAGFGILKKIGLDKDLGEELLSRFEETGNQELLHLVACSAQVVSEVNLGYLFEHLSEPYWRMRAFEALLVAESNLNTDLIHKYPFAFTYAVGRRKHHASLGRISQLFQENQADLDFLSIYTWTIGQLGAREELEVLKPVVEQRMGESIG